MKKFLGVVVLTILLFLGIVYAADTNGIWHRAEDVRAGIFGSDEGDGNFGFNNNLFILGNVGIGTSNSGAKLHIKGDNFAGIFVENSVSNKRYSFYSHPAGSLVIGDENLALARLIVDPSGNVGIGTTPSAKLDVDGDIRVRSKPSCSKLYTDAQGNVLCGTDNVDDADSIIGNEYPIAGIGISVTSGRTVNVDTNIIATKEYVETKSGRHVTCVTTDWVAWFDRGIGINCGEGYLSGVRSYHLNHNEDRRFAYKCCFPEGANPASMTTCDSGSMGTACIPAGWG